jgi:hypothetical protein
MAASLTFTTRGSEFGASMRKRVSPADVTRALSLARAIQPIHTDA